MTPAEKQSFAQLLERYRRPVTIVAVASVLLNIIVFAGSLYMLMVYDSVLPSNSIASLTGLFVMLIVTYVFQALFEAMRGDALLGIANGVHDDLFAAVHYAATNQPLKGSQRGGDGMQPIRDLDQVHSFLAGQGPVALIDLPWVLLFLIVLTGFHWALGLTALLGTLVLAGIAWWTSKQTNAGTRELSNIIGRRAASTMDELRFVESSMAMGMRDRLLARSAAFEQNFLAAQAFLSRTSTRLGSASRIFRLFLQSLILTVGALLVIAGEATGGIILASSVLAGRALAPVDSAIANWRNLSAARAGWSRIVEAVATNRPPNARHVLLGKPKGELTLRDIWVVPPGATEAAVAGVSLTLQPGQALAIIGPSAAGKTTLAKAICGAWRTARGEVRLDGATYDQWDPEVFGANVGYVAQSVDLIEGSVGENIARFDPTATSEAIIAAATVAGLHETILALSAGYDTKMSTTGGEFSAGQRQRLGLARALYGDPFLVVLDEPNSNLDAEGDTALAHAIEAVKARGGIVVMVTHRPATLGPMTHIAVMHSGKITDFGPRDEVLGRATKNITHAAANTAGTKQKATAK